MEDGELDDTAMSVEPNKRGEKRDQSVLDEDDIEETLGLSIKPPPVGSKKHKRHHKKHKVGKEEKKKKRHRRSSDLNERETSEQEVKPEKVDDRRSYDDIRRNYDDRHEAPPLISRVQDSSDYNRRREYASRPSERQQRPLEARLGRGKYYDTKPSDRDYGRDDSTRYNSSNRSSAYKVQSDRNAAYPRKPRDDREYDDRDRYISRRDEGKPKPPLLVRRQYDDDYRQRDRGDRGRHERSVSSSVVVSSISSSINYAPSRKSDSAIGNAYNKKSEDNQYNDSNGHKRLHDDQSSLSQEKKSPPPQTKSRKAVENNEQFHTEVISSEDSSESSDSSESASEEEIEITKRSRRKKDEELSLKRQKGETTTQDYFSSEAEDEEEYSSSDEGDSDESPASGANQSASDDSQVKSDAEDEEVIEEAADTESGSNDEEDHHTPDDMGLEDVDAEHEDDDNERPYDSDLGGEGLASPEHSPVEKEPELPFYYPAIQGCRSVDEFQCLNRIEEGTYGVVYRAKDKRTDEVVALKRLKMEKEREGFPITSLREVSTLLKAHHQNCVRVQEIVVGSNVDKIYIVMDYVEHDLKSLMETMKQPFLVGEVKTLMIQLLRGVHHLHDNWILHRDLKTSNLLLSHKGILKIGDFGLAREYGSPLKPYTPIVVTLWYRSPELLLGSKEYSTAVDLWSVGCIFAEFLSKKPLFPGKSEIMQLNLIFKELGTPSEKIWPGYSELPIVKKTSFAEYPYNTLRKRFGATDISQKGFDLLNRFLTYCPERRISGYTALKHEWFMETPKPVEPSMFPTWPAKSELTKPKRPLGSAGDCPEAPEGAMGYNKLLNEEEKLGFQLTAPKHGMSKHGMGFSLKF